MGKNHHLRCELGRRGRRVGLCAKEGKRRWGCQERRGVWVEGRKKTEG